MQGGVVFLQLGELRAPRTTGGRRRPLSERDETVQLMAALASMAAVGSATVGSLSSAVVPHPRRVSGKKKRVITPLGYGKNAPFVKFFDSDARLIGAASLSSSLGCGSLCRTCSVDALDEHVGDVGHLSILRFGHIEHTPTARA